MTGSLECQIGTVNGFQAVPESEQAVALGLALQLSFDEGRNLNRLPFPNPSQSSEMTGQRSQDGRPGRPGTQKVTQLGDGVCSASRTNRIGQIPD